MSTKFSIPVQFHSPKIERILPHDAFLECLCTGFKFAEGPIWLPAEDSLVFSDISGNTMYRWNSQSGVSVYRRPSGYANGNTIDLFGRLVTCEHGNRRVSRTELDGSVVTLSSHYQGKRLNSPNDVVVRADGSIYFTDPPYGLTAEFGVPGKNELDFQGVYRVSPAGHTLTLEGEDFQTPNGLAFSPDERLLYIDDTERMHVRVFEVKPDGSLGKSRLFAEFDPNLGPGWPDGLKTDIEGNVYVTGPAGIWIFNPEGEVLGVLEMPVTVTNMNWGGNDRRDLYITAATETFVDGAVYHVKLAIPGYTHS
jgi:sugar lactone lactonase YvrE